MKKYSSKLLRVLLLLLIVLYFVLSLDILTENYTFTQVIQALLIHNIFTFFLIAILLIVWKMELLGGLLLIALSIFLMFFQDQFLSLTVGKMIITGFPLLLGILFITNYYFKK